MPAFCAVPDEGGAANGGPYASYLDQIPFGHAEDEVSGGGIDLSSREALGVEGTGRVGDKVRGRDGPGREVGVRHARIGQVPETLTPTVTGRGEPELLASENVGEVTGEDT